MKQYMLSVYHADSGPDLTPEAMEAGMRDVAALNAEMVTTDGPFAESKERIGGFWVINADDLDAALAWARKATVACAAPIEVRPFHDDPDA